MIITRIVRILRHMYIFTTNRHVTLGNTLGKLLGVVLGTKLNREL